MSEIKTFKIEQNFKSIEDLYTYLMKNVEFAGKSIGIQIQKPLKAQPFCLIGKEKITERNILFFASKSDFPENLGELILLAGVFEADVLVFFIPKTDKNHLYSLSWLQKICNDDTQFILGEVAFQI